MTDRQTNTQTPVTNTHVLCENATRFSQSNKLLAPTMLRITPTEVINNYIKGHRADPGGNPKGTIMSD